MKTDNQRAQEFFDKNPEVNEVHLALGKPFTDKQGAINFLRGIPSSNVVTVTREQLLSKPAEQSQEVKDPANEATQPVENTEETTAAVNADETVVNETNDETIATVSADEESASPAQVVNGNKNERKRKK